MSTRFTRMPAALGPALVRFSAIRPSIVPRYTHAGVKQSQVFIPLLTQSSFYGGRHVRSYASAADGGSASASSSTEGVVRPGVVIPFAAGGSHVKSHAVDTNVTVDGKSVNFSQKSVLEIVYNMLVYKICSWDWAVQLAPKVVELSEKLHLSGLMFLMLKYSVFPMFIAGESKEECFKVVDKLAARNMNVILNYCKEHEDNSSPSTFDNNVDLVINSITLASQHKNIRFVCVKPTNFAPTELLVRLSENLTHNRRVKKGRTVTSNDEAPETEDDAAILRVHRPTSPPQEMTAEEIAELEVSLKRLDRICDAAAKHDVPILLDAEETYLQPAADHVAIYASRKYNSAKPLIYNTYQMYLNDAPERLQEALTDSKEKNYVLAAKLVRGAYISKERSKAEKYGYADPINQTIDVTHKQYDAAVDLMLTNLPRTAVVIASHNANSAWRATEKMSELKVPKSTDAVQFAQLFGMSDSLSLTLASEGYTVSKYLPYGPVKNVVPYLLRRLEENHEILQRNEEENKMLWAELMRRFGMSQKKTIQ